MYRGHEAREDTIVLPAFRRVVSRRELDALGFYEALASAVHPAARVKEAARLSN